MVEIKTETLAMAGLAIVLAIALIQTFSLGSLNERVSAQETALFSAAGQNTAGLTSATASVASTISAPQAPVSTTVSAPPAQQVGGC
ncbi:MAG: hypothetical protein V1494_05770 [Candidatus Diapherotrites archaeon]